MPEPTSPLEQHSPHRFRLKQLVMWVLFFGVLYFVINRAIVLWRESPSIQLHVDVRWLFPAALFYLIGWLPSVWLWRALLARMDKCPGLYATLRAHFVGQLGKYAPGKAMLLVIRGSMLKASGVDPVLAGLASAYETLVAMSSGAAVAIALAPTVIPDGLWEKMPPLVQGLRQQPLLVPVVVLICSIASAPFSAWLFTMVGRKAFPRDLDKTQNSTISAKLVIQGFLITILGWVCHAMSLGCTLQAVQDSPFDLTQLPVWLASVSFSMVIGFVILIAPGGLGVREGVLIETLKDHPNIGGEKAILAAGLLRVVWFAAELIVAGPLYAVPDRPTKGSGEAQSINND